MKLTGYFLFAALLLGPMHAATAQVADPRLGSWTLVSAQSTLDPSNELTVTPLPHRAVRVTMTGETRLDFTAQGDGQDTPVPANPAFNQVALKRIDKRQTEVTEKKDGALVATVRVAVSKDDKELTVTTASTGHASQVAVWTRSGGKKAVDDPLAGEWTEDFSKTRLLQQTALKIESAGNGTVHFAGDYSYTARFDGKTSDLRNSRNDSISLALVDPHTVDTSSRRGDVVVQRDRWVVSADGQQMTLTSSGSLETGQHLTEKLVFKKQ